MTAQLRARSPRFRGIFNVLTAAIALTTSAQSQAEVTITKANGQPVPQGAATKTFNPDTGGWTISLFALYAESADTVYEIHGNAGETIDVLESWVMGPPAGSPLIIRVLSDAPDGILDVHQIIQYGTAETLLNKVNVKQDIGSITVEAIGDLTAGRDVVGPIVATTADSTVRGVTTIHAARDILGDVIAENGRILLVWADQNIGSQKAPITIRAKHHVYQVMGLDVFADITTRNNGSNGGLWALVANHYSGNIEMEKLIFNQWNGLDGRIAIYDQFDGRITIGKSFNSAAQYIEVPVHGLGGQIIVNADNVTNGAWSAPVKIGPNGNPSQIVLNGPRYNYPDEQIGGGAVGLVPFRLHDEACVPPNGQTANVIPNAKEPLNIELRHFGPITWNQAQGLPVTIERRTAGSGNSFAAVAPANFTANVSEENPNSLVIGGADTGLGFTPGYEYRIKPKTNLLSDVPALPAVKWDADYLVTVTVPPCDGDANMNGVVDVDDLLLVLGFWGDPPPPFLPGVDVTHNGIVDVDDLLALINAWGPCW